MTVLTRLLGLLLAGCFLTACSGTSVKSSYLSPDYKGQIKNVYIIGIAKNDINRMLFENTFYSRLASEGISAIPSSTDLPKNQEADRELIIQKMRANDCDSVLLTRVVDRRTEATFSSGQGSLRYVPGPSYAGLRVYDRPSYYNNWGSYYSSGYRVAYQQPTVTKFVVLTVESVLYDLQSEELIWSAQMETDLENNIEEMMEKFVDEAVKDLKEKGLI